MLKLISASAVTAEDQVAWVTTYQGATSLRIHAKGFLEIATVGARAVLERRAAIDAVTPAIIYAIRHSVELFLKHVIAELMQKAGLPVEVPRGHAILEILAEHRETITSVLDDEALHGEHHRFSRREWLAEFEEIVNRLHQINPDGQTLRYPTNLDGVQNLGCTMQVSLAQLQRFGERAAFCFDQFSQRCC